MTCNDHLHFEFADAVVIRENVGNIAIGNVVTVDSDSEAKVSTRLGKKDVILDFEIPRGKDGGLEKVTIAMIDALSLAEAGTWHIYHDALNDTYDIYGFANVENEITAMADFTDNYKTYTVPFPFLIPADYLELFSRNIHPTVRGDVTFDKGGFYMDCFSISVASQTGYVIPRWNGVGIADDGCKASGTVSFHIHVESE